MRIIFLGAPCSGKGTQAGKLLQDYDMVHISTGDIFRANISGGTELGKKAKDYIDQGLLVPDELVIDLVKDRLNQSDCQTKGFLLDGFPRTLPQAIALEQFAKIDAVISLNVPDKDILERVSGRWMCRCGSTYNVRELNNEYICKKCGKELYQRADDNAETMKNRLDAYNRETPPMIEYYRGKGILVDINGAGRTPEEVYNDIKEALSK